MSRQQAALAALPEQVRGVHPGAQVRVRNRPALVLKVDSYGFDRNRPARLVELVYCDGQQPGLERVLWEVEEGEVTGGARTLAPRPTSRSEVEALAATTVWTASMPFPGMDESADGRLTALAPACCAFQPEEFQLAPLARALAMPRIRLLLADEVGLGKTIQAGLIITEMLLRRRCRRVLVIAPPALIGQWQQELWSKFSLDFVAIDRAFQDSCRRRSGPDESCWSTVERAIVSPHYLRQPAVLEQFQRSCGGRNRPHLPWDLLVVDEAHHFMGRSYRPEGTLVRMLREVTRWFEHRLFLSATPHDGYSESLTGLLEILDPLRFRATASPTPAERRRMAGAIIRRTRTELAAVLPSAGRRIESVPVAFTPAEQHLYDCFTRLRKTVTWWGQSGQAEQRATGQLAVAVLAKRLLSSLPAFALSFAALHAAAVAPEPSVKEQSTASWQETAGRLGSWMRNHYPGALQLLEEIRQALLALGLDGSRPDSLVPDRDGRREAFLGWLAGRLPSLASGRPAERGRVIVFTEFKSTLDYLDRCIQERFPAAGQRTVCLSGESTAATRQALLSAFLAPGEASASLLLCTDIAAEGLNLHPRADSLFHFDLPWNPAAIEQRIGRLDRLGQQDRVDSFHFVSPAEHELRFLGRVGAKAWQMAHDLGGFDRLLTLPEEQPRRPVQPLLLPAPPPPPAEGPPSRPEDRGGLGGTVSSGSCSDVRLERVTDERLWCLPGQLHQGLAEAIRLGGGRLCEVPAGWSIGGLTPPLRESLGLLLTGPGSRAPVPELPLLTFERPGRAREGQLSTALFPHPGHPLLRWAHAVLTARAAGAIPWCAVTVPGEVAAILALLREVGVNGHHQPIHERPLFLLLQAFRRKRAWIPSGRPRLLGPEEAGRLLAPAGPGIPPLPEARALWRQAGGQLLRAVREHQQEHQRLLVRLLARERRAESRELSESFALRRQELVEQPALQLRSRLAELEEARRRGFLFEEMAREAACEEQSLRQEQRECARRLRELQESLDWELSRSLKELLPMRYALLGPLSCTVQAVALLLPVRGAR